MNQESPVYMVVQSEIHPEALDVMEQYLTASRPLMSEYGVEVVLSGEGLPSPHSSACWPRNSVLKFPSYAAAEALLADPRYQAIKERYRDPAYKTLQSSFFTPRTPKLAPALEVGTRAFEHFSHGLATGQWEPFLAMLTDDFTFHFPKGRFKGEQHGKERAREFFTFVSQVFADGLTVHLDRVTHNANTVVFEFRDEGTLRGEPYHNRVMVAFDVRDDKICGYREYFGLE